MSIKRDFPRVNLIVNQENVGFAAGNNQIIEQTKSDYVLLLNPDTVSEVSELVKLFAIAESNPKIGILGGQLHDGNGNVQVICEHFPYPWRNFINGMGLYRLFSAEWRSKNLLGEFYDYEGEGPVEWLVGAYLIVRREAINKAGLIPEDYFMFAEAMHWCYLMWENDYEVWYSAKSRIIHKMNRSARQLPQMWRVEKSTLCKYVFCYGEFGWLNTKFIELTDFMSYTFGIWRLMFRKPEPIESQTWKMNRQIIWQSLKLSPKETARRQLEKFTPTIITAFTALNFF